MSNHTRLDTGSGRLLRVAEDSTLKSNAALRRERLRARAASLGLEGVLAYSWRRGTVPALTGYLPGFVTNSSTLWLPVEGTPVLGVRFGFELARASALFGGDVVHASRPVDVLPPEIDRIGVLAGDMGVDETPVALVDALAGIHAVDLSEWADEDREIKTDREIDGLTLAALTADAALRAADAAFRAGATDFEIAASVEAVARADGAHRATCLIGFGRGAVVTEAHGAVLAPGEPVGLELNLVRDGYFSHAQRTLLARDASAVDHAAHRACFEARAAMMASIRPGVAVADVVAAGDRVLAAHGLLDAKEYDFGHGIGWDTPEHPRLLAESTRDLKAGSVLALHAAVRRAGGETAFVGGPVAIGESGCRELVPGACWTRA